MTSNSTLGTLYSDHHGWLTRWLYRRLGCADNAADLAQDTFLRLISGRGASHHSDIRQPRCFLATVARRVLTDHLRRQSLERAYLEALAAEPEATAPSPELQAIIIETLCQIDTMLDGLGSKVRQAFLLAQIDGLGYAEIAVRLGVSVSSVKKYMARATEHCLLYSLGEE